MTDRPVPTPPNLTPASRPGQGRFFDFRRLPPGVMPPHLQQWVLLAIALVMIAILAVSGPAPKPRPAAPASPTANAVDPNQQRIEDYQRRIDEQVQHLALEQSRLQVAKNAVVANADTVSSRSGHTVPGTIPDTVPGTQPPAAAPVPVASDGRAADNVAFSRSTTAPAKPVSTPSASGEELFILLEGTVIETVLTNRLDGTFNGPVNCLVSVPAYASDHLVIPAGARALGQATAVNTFGQSRLAVVFHRLIQPNGVHVNLDQFHGLNQAGDAGLTDQVDRHYAQIFGASLALGAVAGFAQARSPVGLDITAFDTYRQGIGASVSQSSARILDRFLNLLPTVTIREGHRIKIYLSSDLALPAYRNPPPPTGGRR